MLSKRETMTPVTKTQINPFISLRELFPLFVVILCLFGIVIYSVANIESPKSKPIVRNEGFVQKISR